MLPEQLSDPAFRRRRFLNWFPLGITYAVFYMGRYNLNIVSTEFMSRFHMSKAEFGIIATAGYWTYALAVLLNGPLTDRFGARRSILTAALGTMAINGVIGLLFWNGWTAKVLVGMSLLYSLNQYFQSFGALSVVKANAPWFHVRERGVIGGVFGAMISGGYFLALTVGGWILAAMPWYCVFLIPAAAAAAIWGVDYALVADTPRDAGFSNFDTGDASGHRSDRDEPADFRYLMTHVFSNRVILTLAAAEFCTGFVRQGLMLWFVPFLAEVHHITHGSALFSIATLGITVGGVIGSLLSGVLSDKVFGSRRPPVAFLFYCAQILCLWLLGRAAAPWAAAVLIGVCCTWIFGVHGMLSGTASMDFGGAKAAATVTGLLDGIQYVASGLAGFLLGAFLDRFGWGGWTWAILPFSAAGAVLMTFLWNAVPRPAEPAPRADLVEEAPVLA